MQAYNKLKIILAIQGIILSIIYGMYNIGYFHSIDTVNAKNNNYDIEYYRNCATQIEKEEGYTYVIDSSELTREMIISRGNKLLIERVIGVVVDNERNGKILNPSNPQFDYISYKGKYDGFTPKKGDIMLSYILYNPGTNGEDEYIARWDYTFLEQ